MTPKTNESARAQLRAGPAVLPARPGVWPASWPWSYAGLALAAILAVTAARLLVVMTTHLDLVPDEAQYWAWSLNFEFGYFSKPPMIAWLIGATTAMCGEGTGCVRSSAPLLHGATAGLVFYLARTLFDDRTAFWSAITYVLLPGVTFSATIISTDVPLLFFWAAALLALAMFIRVRSEGTGNGLALAALAGLAIGLGFLSKYAMIYFVISAALVIVLDAAARRALISWPALLMPLFAGLAFLPNVLWNWAEGWPTARHTAANANWGADLFNPEKFAEFFVGQFAVFGPLPFIMLLFGLMTLRRRFADGGRSASVFLLTFALPVLAIVLVQSFISRANANWAAPAYVSATVLVVHWLLTAGLRPVLIASTVLHLAMAASLYAIFSSPDVMRVTATEGMLKRARAWDDLGLYVMAEAGKAPYTAIMGDDRLVTAEITYYARASGLPVVMWDLDGHPQNHFEFRVPFRADLGSPILYVTPSANPTLILDRFETRTLLGSFKLPAKTEEIRLWRLETYLGDAAGKGGG